MTPAAFLTLAYGLGCDARNDNEARIAPPPGEMSWDEQTEWLAGWDATDSDPAAVAARHAKADALEAEQRAAYARHPYSRRA
jgi:hypothetical protein